jgi:cyclopropane fatty-acyl-phospholipid synthase-like methyltransferase
MLKPDGVFVMEVITTLEAFYEDAAKVGYAMLSKHHHCSCITLSPLRAGSVLGKAPGFINTIVFPGCCCPSIAALLSAAANHRYVARTDRCPVEYCALSRLMYDAASCHLRDWRTWTYTTPRL